MKSKYSKELVNKIKEYYINNKVSLEMLSENSKDLFGVNIPLPDLKYLSRNDLDGNWSILRANGGRSTEEVPIIEKLEKVANKLYELIIDDDSGVSSNQVAQVARTWSDLVDKSKLSSKTSTAKTTAQQAKDLFEKELLKNARH